MIKYYKAAFLHKYFELYFILILKIRKLNMNSDYVRFRMKLIITDTTFENEKPIHNPSVPPTELINVISSQIIYSSYTETDSGGSNWYEKPCVAL